jgi:hypothetical protein
MLMKKNLFHAKAQRREKGDLNFLARSFIGLRFGKKPILSGRSPFPLDLFISLNTKPGKTGITYINDFQYFAASRLRVRMVFGFVKC